MTTKKKRPVTGGLRVKAYDVLQRAVDDGLNFGWNRAHKHTDKPSEDAIKDAMFGAVMGEICDWFDFDDGEDT